MYPLKGLENPLAPIVGLASVFPNPRSMLFDGIDEYVDCGNGADVKMGTGDFSAFAWVKRGALGVAHTVLSYGATSDPRWYFRIETGDRVRVLVDDGTTLSRMTSDATFLVDDADWHLIGFTFDRSEADGLLFYKDGSPAASGLDGSGSNLTLDHASVGLRIGARLGPINTFHGNVDEVSLWGRVLTGLEATELYNLGVPGDLSRHSVLADLLTWWRMGDRGTWSAPAWTIPDQKGTSDGTSVNMAKVDVVTDTP